jgi:hypothetical protein
MEELRDQCKVVFDGKLPESADNYGGGWEEVVKLSMSLKARAYN